MRQLRSPRASILFLALLALAAPAAAQPIALGGQIADAEGEPLAGARVSLLPYPGRHRLAVARLEGRELPVPAQVRCDAQGRFEIEALASGIWLLRAAAGSHAEMGLLLAPLVDSRELRPILLPRSQQVAVRVLGSEGGPVPSALVMANPRWERPYAATREPVSPRSQVAHTDARGQVELSLPAGSRFDLAVAAPGHVSWQQRGLETSAVEVRLETGVARTLIVEGANRRPLGGAAVLAGHLPLARTDAEGRAVLHLPNEPDSPGLTVQVLAEDGAVGIARLGPGDPEPSRIRVVLTEIEGRVVVAESRIGIAGALVWSASEPAGSVRSDADGVYRLAVSRPGMTLQAAAPGSFPANAGVDPGAVSSGIGPTLVLEPGGRIEGIVEDGDGTPLAGVEVRMTPMRGSSLRGSNATARSRTDGRFELSPVALERSLRLTARAVGYAPAQVEVPPRQPDRPTPVRLVLQPGRSAFGTVVDEAEEPVVGALLTLRPTLGGAALSERIFARTMGTEVVERATSDGEGRFAFTDLAPGRYDLRAEANDFAPATVPGVEIPEPLEPSEIGTLMLSPGVVVEGLVVDTSGRPLGGAEVRMAHEDSLVAVVSPLLADREPDAVSAPDGRFALVDLAAGGRIRLEVKRQGYVSIGIEGVQAPTEKPLEIRLESAGSLRGEVADESGDPLPRAAVQLVRERENRPRTDLDLSSYRHDATTDRSGRFEVTELLPGRWQLTASARGFQPTTLPAITVMRGVDGDDLKIVLRPGAVVHGTVSSAADDEPLSGALVRHWVETHDPFSPSARPSVVRADGEGTYRLDGLPTGRLTLVAEEGRHLRQVRDLVVQLGENRLDFRLEAGREIRGQVIGPRGEPIGGARVEAQPSSPSSAIVSGAVGSHRSDGLSGDEGRFVLAGLEDGSYVVSADKEGFAHGVHEGTVEIAGDSVDGILLQLEVGATLTGLVSGLAQDELPLLQVIAMQQGISTTTPLMAQVDHRGEYRVDHLPPGEWLLFAMIGKGGKMRRQPFKVEPRMSELRVDLDFAGGLSLSGRVLRRSREPVLGYSVYAIGRKRTGSAQATTDQQGRFRLEGLEADTYQVTVARVGGSAHVEEVELQADRELVIELVEVTVSGRVVAAGDGLPIAGAELSLAPLESDTTLFQVPLGAPPRSDRDGGFRLSPVTPGRYRLWAEREGYAAGGVDLEIGELDLDGIELRLESASGITLYVLDASGAPVRSVEILALDGSERPILAASRQAGEGGQVRLDRLPTGVFTLLLAPSLAAGTTVERRVEVPGDPVVIRLPAIGDLRVTLPELIGSGRRGRVTLRDQQGRPYRSLMLQRTLQEWTIDNGTALLPALPVGTWIIEATVDERTWSATATVLAGTVVDAVLE